MARTETIDRGRKSSETTAIVQFKRKPAAFGTLGRENASKSSIYAGGRLRL
jgi:hypothetical protein